jgi:hypothetical protein
MNSLSKITALFALSLIAVTIPHTTQAAEEPTTPSKRISQGMPSKPAKKNCVRRNKRTNSARRLFASTAEENDQTTVNNDKKYRVAQ